MLNPDCRENVNINPMYHPGLGERLQVRRPGSGDMHAEFSSLQGRLSKGRSLKLGRTRMCCLGL